MNEGCWSKKKFKRRATTNHKGNDSGDESHELVIDEESWREIRKDLPPLETILMPMLADQDEHSFRNSRDSEEDDDDKDRYSVPEGPSQGTAEGSQLQQQEQENEDFSVGRGGSEQIPLNTRGSRRERAQSRSR